MAVIEERKNNKGEKSYRVKVRLKGFPIQTATFNKKTDAKNWAQQTEVAIREGRYFNYSASKRKLVNDMIERYIDEILPRKSSKTIITQTQQLEYWKGVIGHLRLEEVTPSLIIGIRNDLSIGRTDRKKKRTNATVNRYTSVLLHVFNVAMKEWEWVHDNPCAKVSKLKESRGRTRYLSEDELKLLLKACKESTSTHLYGVVVMALSTGARKGEILSLKWSDVDFKREVIVIQESKNGEKRTVPLQGHALEILYEKLENKKFCDGFVFSSDNCDTPSCIRTAWRHAVKKAQIQDFCFYDLRHTAASYFAMSGAAITDIAEILGHKTIQMTKRYTHLHIDHTKKVVARMNSKFLSSD